MPNDPMEPADAGKSAPHRPISHQPKVGFSLPPTDHAGIEVRDVDVADVAVLLRAVLGLPSRHPSPGELSAALRRPLPSKVHDLDTGSWIAWCLVGLPLFATDYPGLAQVRVVATRVAIARAMLVQHGNISRSARMLGITRKVLRDHLRLANLYPWRRGPDDEHDPETSGR